MPRGIPKDRSLIDQLTKTHFLATEDQIQALAGKYVNGLQAQDSVRGSYLKVLLAGTQKAAKPAKKLASEVAEILEKTHDAYYAVVMKGVTTPEILDEESLDAEARTLRSLERNRRSNFARSAKASLASYLKAGGDLFTLDPVTVTKAALQAFVLSMRAKTADATTLHKATVAAERIETLCRELADEDQDVALQTVQELMARMANLLTEFGKEHTTKTLVAMKEHRPLKLAEGMFWPMGRAVAPRASVQ